MAFAVVVEGLNLWAASRRAKREGEQGEPVHPRDTLHEHERTPLAAAPADLAADAEAPAKPDDAN